MIKVSDSVKAYRADMAIKAKASAEVSVIRAREKKSLEDANGPSLWESLMAKLYNLRSKLF